MVTLDPFHLISIYVKITTNNNAGCGADDTSLCDPFSHRGARQSCCLPRHSQVMIKMTGETPEVRSDKRKPREDRQNHRYHGSHR